MGGEWVMCVDLALSFLHLCYSQKTQRSHVHDIYVCTYRHCGWIVVLGVPRNNVEHTNG